MFPPPFSRTVTARQYPSLVRLGVGVMELALGRAPEPDQPLPANLAEVAGEHRVAPFVLDTLMRAGRSDDPNLQALAAVDLHVRHQYALAERELARVASAATNVGIDLCLVKGIANAERWFPEAPDARYASDLDFFVRPDHIERVDALVEALEPGHRLRTVASQLMRANVLPDIPVRGERVLIELHANPYAFTVPPHGFDEFWDRTEPATTRSGIAIRRLDPTDALIQALVNSAKDNHAYLLQVLEIGRAVADPAIDWDRVGSVARRHRWEDVIDDALTYVTGLLGVTRPDVTFDRSMVNRAALRLLAPPSQRLGGTESWRRAQRFCKLDLAVPGRRLGAVQAMGGRTFSPTPLITAYAPDLNGPYPWRAARFWVRRQQYVKGHRTTLGPD